MSDYLIDIFNSVCKEYEHIIEKFKIFITLNTVLSVLALKYLSTHSLNISELDKYLFIGIVVIIFLTIISLLALLLPINNYVLVKQKQGGQNRSGNHLDIFDIRTYDCVTYLGILQEVEGSEATSNHSQKDLAKASCIILKAQSAASIHFVMRLTICSLMLWLALLGIHFFFTFS